MASSWERLAHVTQSSDASSLSSGTFTAKTHLKVIGHLSQETPVEPDIRFNNDSGSNYATRLDYGSGDNTYASRDRILNYGYSPSGTADGLTHMDIINIANQEKMVMIETDQNNNGAGNAPMRREHVAKWSRTSGSGTGDASAQITRITFVDLGSGALIKAGSTITVWGADDQPSTPFYPNLPNGTIFEQTNDYKYYMWDGTSAWTVVATT